MVNICCIAAHDSSNGAGITRDCIVAHDFGIWAHPAITAITAQSFEHVEQIWPLPPNQLGNQLESIAKNFPLSAIKIGMLYSPENVNTVANFLSSQINVPIIVDPVIVSSGGNPLITGQALILITEKILPLAYMVTPNRFELETLTSQKVMNINEAFQAAQKLVEKYNCKVLLKGGHFEGTVLNDFIIGEDETIEVSHERRKYEYSHGSGCVLSTALTCSLALGYDCKQALSHAVNYTIRYFDSMNISMIH